MIKFFAVFFVTATGLLSACQRPQPASLALERQHFELTGPSRCDTLANQGISLDVSYFQLKDQDEAARRINDSLHQVSVASIVGWLDSTTVARNPEARNNLSRAATLFAADYESLRKDMGGMGGCWELKTTADTVHSGPRSLTVKVETFAYTGGAHPNSNLAFYNFDRETGCTLALNDLVSDTTALLGLVEKAFRRKQDLQPQYNLEEEGYFLRDGKFFLPANVGFGRKGMVFYYNPYEIAAYALGPIEVTVPYEQLNGVLRHEWL